MARVFARTENGILRKVVVEYLCHRIEHCRFFQKTADNLDPKVCQYRYGGKCTCTEAITDADEIEEAS